MTATHSEREQFVAALIRACPKATASTCQRLLRLGATYKRLCEQSQTWDVRSRRMTIENRSKAIARQCDVEAYPCTGKHSVCIYLLNGDQPNTGMIPIPTS